LTFNIPSMLRHENNILYYEAHPRIMAIILNKYTTIPSFCTYLVHNVTSEAMPSLFEQPLNLIAKIISTRLSVPHEILVRKKREMTPFTNFLMWMSGDTPHRIHNIETEEIRHFNMIK
jgi:hypothetical protein